MLIVLTLSRTGFRTKPGSLYEVIEGVGWQGPVPDINIFWLLLDRFDVCPGQLAA